MTNLKDIEGPAPSPEPEPTLSDAIDGASQFVAWFKGARKLEAAIKFVQKSETLVEEANHRRKKLDDEIADRESKLKSLQEEYNRLHADLIERLRHEEAVREAEIKAALEELTERVTQLQREKASLEQVVHDAKGKAEKSIRHYDGLVAQREREAYELEQKIANLRQVLVDLKRGIPV